MNLSPRMVGFLVGVGVALLAAFLYRRMELDGMRRRADASPTISAQDANALLGES